MLFESFNGKQYSDNPRAISEALHLLDPSFEIVWAFHDVQLGKSLVPGYVRVVKRNTPSFYKEIATSFSYIRNTQFDRRIVKRKGEQIFIQPWHGDRAFKKILFQSNPKRKDVCDFKVVDYCVAGSDFGRQLFIEAFRFKGKILSYGCPRNDALLSLNIREEKRGYIKRKYGIANDVRILLYAPTFRDNKTDEQSTTLDIERVLSQLEQNTLSKWVCFLRAHSNVTNGLNVEQSNRIIDVSRESDAADLLCAIDYLITDYSSIATDFMLLKKPIILATFDAEEYEKNSREFAVRPNAIGLFTANTNDEVLSIISSATNSEYEERCQIALDYYGTKETGVASKKVASLIRDKYLRNNS